MVSSLLFFLIKYVVIKPNSVDKLGLFLLTKKVMVEYNVFNEHKSGEKWGINY